VNRLQNRVTECHAVDGEVGTTIGGLESKRDEAKRHITEEFEAQQKIILEAMEQRKVQLCDMATEHFRLMEEKLKEKRDNLSTEKNRLNAVMKEGIEALALDDAWFIQAYPDINLEGGASVIQSTRDLLNAKIGGWSVDFNPELRGNAKVDAQMVPAIKSHGQVQHGGNSMVDSYFQASPTVSPRATPSQPVTHADVQHTLPPRMREVDERTDATGLSVDSIIEAQVQTMMKCVK